MLLFSSNAGLNPNPEVTKGSSTAYTSTQASLASQQSKRNTLWTPSESHTNSVGIMVQHNLRNIKTQLEVDCKNGVADVFAVGRNRSEAVIFDQAYGNYSNGVHQLDSNISSYLKVNDDD